MYSVLCLKVQNHYMNNDGMTLFSYHLLKIGKMRSPHLGITDQIHHVIGVLSESVTRMVHSQLKNNWNEKLWFKTYFQRIWRLHKIRHQQEVSVVLSLQILMNQRWIWEGFLKFLSGKAAECFPYVAFANQDHLYSKSPTSCNNEDSANGNITNEVLSSVLPIRSTAGLSVFLLSIVTG